VPQVIVWHDTRRSAPKPFNHLGLDGVGSIKAGIPPTQGPGAPRGASILLKYTKYNTYTLVHP
jgi:hypothetical protein